MTGVSPRLALRGVELRVPGPRVLARALDLELTPGAVTAIVGPNGAGKSTLLRVLAGLRAPDAGEVWLGDRPIARWPGPARAQLLAWLPQSTPLYADLRVAELVALGRAPHRGYGLLALRPFAAADADAVTSALAQVDAVGLRERRVFSLSGGEYQRVLLARMLATGAPLLLLDEPTAALDVGQALAFLAQLRRLRDRGHTVALAIHDLEYARRVADHVVLLGAASGSVVQGPPASVLTPAHLGPIFQVEVRVGADGLVFDGPLSAR